MQRGHPSSVNPHLNAFINKLHRLPAFSRKLEFLYFFCSHIFDLRCYPQFGLQISTNTVIRFFGLFNWQEMQQYFIGSYFI